VFCSGVFGRIRDSSTLREYASTLTAERFWAFISAHPQISTLQNHVQHHSQFHPHPTLANIFCRTSPDSEVKEQYITHDPHTALLNSLNLHFPTYIPYKSNPDFITVTQTYQALCIHDEVYSELLSIH
jgi:hypothetical protein